MDIFAMLTEVSTFSIKQCLNVTSKALVPAYNKLTHLKRHDFGS